MNGRTLDTVYTSLMDVATIDELFREVDVACERVHVRVRFPGRSDSAAVSTLAAARDSLDQGAAVQLRYEVDGVVWSDTLQPQPNGVRVIRCRLPST